MIILDGKKIAQRILNEIKSKMKKNSSRPGLGVILVGQDAASKIYVALKEKAAREAGMEFKKIEMPENISEDLVLEEIEKLNNDEKIHGIIVQLPLPQGLDKNKIIETISPKKDADGFCPENLEKFFAGKAEILPVFPTAILELIKSSGQELSGKKAVIICNSEDFGKAMQFILKKEGIESKYILCQDAEKNYKKIKTADILITACGEKGLIKGEMLKDGAIVIDGGIVKIGKKIFGDVDFKSVKSRTNFMQRQGRKKPKAGTKLVRDKNKNIFLSSVPGGVGPVTIACLLKNVWLAYKKSQ